MANETADATEATEADEAEANVADEAEANEAESAANEANVAEKANVIDEIDAANEANVAKEANVIDEIVGANEAIDTNEAIDAEENEANEADEANEFVMLSPLTLTKYNVFVAEAKEYFGINNNQLGGPFGGNNIGLHRRVDRDLNRIVLPQKSMRQST